MSAQQHLERVGCSDTLIGKVSASYSVPSTAVALRQCRSGADTGMRQQQGSFTASRSAHNGGLNAQSNNFPSLDTARR